MSLFSIVVFAVEVLLHFICAVVCAVAAHRAKCAKNASDCLFDDIPAIIGTYGRHEKKETLRELAGPEDCIECGACTACCPERIAVKDLMREFAMRQCQHRSHLAYVSALR